MRLRIFAFVIALGLLLTACGTPAPTGVHVVPINDTSFIVDVDRQTITVDDVAYAYTRNVSRTDAGTHTTITYPDGETYWWTTNGYTGQGGWSDGYSEATHFSGSQLILALDTVYASDAKQSSGEGIPYFIFGGITIALGLFQILAPRAAAWMEWLRFGWRYMEEPNETMVSRAPIGGMICLAVGFVIVLVGFMM